MAASRTPLARTSGRYRRDDFIRLCATDLHPLIFAGAAKERGIIVGRDLRLAFFACESIRYFEPTDEPPVLAR